MTTPDRLATAAELAAALSAVRDLGRSLAAVEGVIARAVERLNAAPPSPDLAVIPLEGGLSETQRWALPAHEQQQKVLASCSVCRLPFGFLPLEQAGLPVCCPACLRTARPVAAESEAPHA